MFRRTLSNIVAELAYRILGNPALACTIWAWGHDCLGKAP